MDPQGNRILLIDPDSKRTVYLYDELNRLETMTLDDGQVVGYDYFPDGLKKTVTNPNGTVSTYLYDAADRMTDISHVGPTGTISSYAYDYDPNSNRERQVEQNAGRTETTEYTYDFVNRLKTVTYPDKAVAYEYDPAGNRIQEVTTGAEASDKTLHYDAINRLLSIDSNVDAEDVAYQYDPNGNTTQKTKNGVTTTFHYDIRDQLGEVREGPNVLGRYGYDFDGRRILKIGNEGRRQYTYDQLSVITEADPANATVSKYDYGLDQLVRLDNRNEGRSFFHLDVLRSTVSLTDTAGALRQSIFYDAWGNERERIGTSANNFTFTGHELDEETGLIYAKARFYDAEVGRFLSQDSLLGEAGEPPSLHRYFYALENPLRFIDPNGQQSLAAAAEEEKRRRAAVAEARASGVLPSEGLKAETAGLGGQVFTEEAQIPDRPDQFMHDADTQRELGRIAQAVEAERESARQETVISEEQALMDTVNDPALTALLFQRRDTARAIRNIGAVGSFVGETYVVVAAGTANDVLILATGKDLNEREASRWLAAGAIILVGVTAAEIQALNRVDDELRGASQGKRGRSGSNAAGGRGASQADTPVPTRGGGSGGGSSGGGGGLGGGRNLPPRDDWPELSGMLRDASRGKGNFGVGKGTREQAQAMGEAWVGPGFRTASDGKTLVSADGLRQYRPPSFKPNLDKFQANFEARPPGITQWQSNAHLDILDP